VGGVDRADVSRIGRRIVCFRLDESLDSVLVTIGQGGRQIERSAVCWALINI